MVLDKSNYFDDMNKYISILNSFGRRIIDLIELIDKKLIDYARSKVEFYRDTLFIEVYSIDNKYCPLTFSIGTRNEYENCFGLYYNRHGQVLFDERAESEEDFITMMNFMHNMITASVCEKQIYSNNCIKKRVFIYTFNADNNKGQIYTAINKILWPWEKKEIKIINYIPWVIS